MKMWHGLPFEIHPKPDRRNMMSGHHRDVSASAFSIAQWEDDGGRIGGVRTSPIRAPSTMGRMIPHGSRDL
jgi:hypothetical protein